MGYSDITGAEAEATEGHPGIATACSPEGQAQSYHPRATHHWLTRSIGSAREFLFLLDVVGNILSRF